MFRLFLTVFTFLVSLLVASAQFDIRPAGPFAKKDLKAGQPVAISVVNVDPDLQVEEYSFQVYVDDGGTRRTLVSQSGGDWWIWADLYSMPIEPTPQMAVTLRVRHKNSGTPYTITKVFPIQFVDAVFNIGELRLSDYYLDQKIQTRLVGGQVAAVYTLWSLPLKTSSAMLAVIGPAGDTIARSIKRGSPYLRESEVLQDTVVQLQWPGGCRLRGTVIYEGGPEGGYTMERIIPDSIPVPVVTASAGFGPFSSSRDQPNEFVVKGLGSRCTSVQWSIQYTTENGHVRTPMSETRAYDAAKDSMHFVYNMRDVSHGSRLIVRALFGPYLPATEQSYVLDVARPSPVFSVSGSMPITPGVDRVDTVFIDSLPPRIVNLRMVLTSGSGAEIREVTTKRIAPAYIRQGKLTFNARDLSLGTYVVRVRALNEYHDDAPDAFYGFDVRDTSAFFLIADSWGPYTQGDSATITPAITDMRPVTGPKPDKIIGRFFLLDSLNPAKPLATSVDVDLSGVQSRDSVVHWPTSAYTYGAAKYNREHIQTIDLPRTTYVRFERLIVRGIDTTRDNILEHPVFIVPSPGNLSASPRFDSAFTVTRNAPITMRLSNIVKEATGVRFSVLGMKDPDPVVQEIVTRKPGQDEVSWTIDAGMLPVNAKVIVNAVSSLTNNVGAEIVRLINTVPDSLYMQAIPPIDTLTMEWDIDPKTQLIRGVGRFTPTLTFTRIPAQTRSIQLLSFDDQGAIIDSVEVQVPYRTIYDRNLTVITPFTFRTFNTAALQVRYISDGGPDGGIRYTRNITTRFSVPLEAVAHKMNFATKPPSFDNSPVLQGSNDIVDMRLLWRIHNPTSTVGYRSELSIDSVLLELFDCAGNIVDKRRIVPTAPMVTSGSAAQTLYTVTKLPLSTAHLAYTLYSKSMTLPSNGVTLRAPLTLRTNPILNLSLGTTYPTYRVTDTVTATLKNPTYITNLNGVVSVDSLVVRDKSGKAVEFINTLPVRGDTIRLGDYEMNLLHPSAAPYVITCNVTTATCAQTKTLHDTLAVLTVPRVLDDPATSNWVYSSKGWGPFQQGRAPITNIVVNCSPASFIKSRAPLADSLELGIVGWSRVSGTFTTETPTKVSYPASAPLPDAVRSRAAINLTPFDTASAITLHVRWYQRSVAGVKKVLDTLYPFPVWMLDFPDQVIETDSTEYEQSVLAGSSSKVMQHNYNFRMVPPSVNIDALTFAMLSTTDNRIDTLSIAPSSRNSIDTTSVFEMHRDVAQYPWPYVARDRDKVRINVGYQFSGSTKPTKIQKTSITILPRADWLNGSTAYLNGTPSDSMIPISVSIPMPSTHYMVSVPLFDTVQYGIEPVDRSLTTNFVVNASYNPNTKQFTIGSNTQSGSTWIPWVSVLGGLNYNSFNIAKDKEEWAEFEALYRFEKAPLADESETEVPNRELRVRSWYSSEFRGPVAMVRWIMGISHVINKFIKLGASAATGGVVWVEPTFVLDGYTQHGSTINIGTEEKGALLHINEDEEVNAKTEQNAFPTSQSLGLAIEGGGALEVSLLGLVGVDASITGEYLFASGSTFDGPVSERRSKYYPTSLNSSSWFNLELQLFFGIINIDLFRGCLYSWYDPETMPAFPVFHEGWESMFKGLSTRKPSDKTQVVSQLAKLPEETPYYRPAPCIAADNENMVTVHLEQSLLGSSGKIVLSSLDKSTHALRTSAVIADNRNAIHDPTVTLLGNGGNALVAWLQNDYGAKSVYGTSDYANLLRTENVHLAFYDANAQRVQHLPEFSDASQDLIDGKPSIAVGVDSVSAMIAWPAMEPSTMTSDIYVRSITREGNSWKYGDARRVARLPGVDHDVNISAMDNGTYVVTWTSSDLERGDMRVLSATLTPDAVSNIAVLAHIPQGALVTDVEMVGNGSEAVLLFGRSVNNDSVEYARSLEVLFYRNGRWSAPASFPEETGRGLYRHIEASLQRDGSFFAMIDGIDHKDKGPVEHTVSAYYGSIYETPSQWRMHKNNVTYTEPYRAIWSMSAGIGPNRTLYVATQELDTVRDNRQTYRNGLQLGPTRCNAVVRAMRMNDKGDLVAVPFTNSPTSVQNDHNDELESTLRYRVKVMDPAPNPVREACVVPLAVQRSGFVTVKLLDELGGHVSTLYSGIVDEGIQGVSFETSGLTSGHYTVVVYDNVGVAGSVPIVVVN